MLPPASDLTAGYASPPSLLAVCAPVRPSLTAIPPAAPPSSSQGLDFNLSAFHPRGADVGLGSSAYQQSAYAGAGIGGMAFQRAHIGRAGLQQQQSSSSYGRGLSQWSTIGGSAGGLASTSGAYGFGGAGGIVFEARNDADAVVTLTVLSADCTTRAADMCVSRAFPCRSSLAQSLTPPRCPSRRRTIAPGQVERVQLQPDL